MVFDRNRANEIVDTALAQLKASQEYEHGPAYSFGIFQFARVVKLDEASNRVIIKILEENRYMNEIAAIYPGFMATPDGSGIWHGLSVGDTVLVGFGPGNRPIIFNKVNNISSNVLNVHSIVDSLNDNVGVTTPTDAFSIRTKMIKNSPASGLMSVDCRPGYGISVGAVPFASMNIDFFPGTVDSDKYYSVISSQSGQNYTFSEAGHSINGVIFRSLRAPDASIIDIKRQDRWYFGLTPVCMDPTRNRATSTDENRIKNPPFVENRNIIYEFADGSEIESDSNEEKKQNIDSAKAQTDIYNSRQPSSRRSKKNDVLSLSLVSPNQLIESVSGTLVDVYGNVLDLNRHKLPLDETTKLDGSVASYDKIRELHRKGVAYHWELNARKDLKNSNIESGNSESGQDYGKNFGDYSRNRSRLFLDIDKEGQFKLNIPASSEKGNIGLLTRYENVSTTKAPTQDSGPNFDTFVFSDNDTSDIVLDSFGVGSVSLSGDTKSIPTNRFDNTVIKLGTCYHNISKTCCEPIFTDSELSGTGLAIFGGPDEIKENVVTTSINIDGDSANAGGRSGTINFDGMISLSIGANTIDRQSMWLDLAGGMISRFGRDKNNISFCTQMDGHFYLQLGGTTPSDDTRFTSDKGFDNTAINTKFEIRVMHRNNRYHRIFIDETGIYVTSASDITFTASSNIVFNASQIVMNGELNQNHTQFYDLDAWRKTTKTAQDSRPIAEQEVYGGGIDSVTGAV